MTVLLVLLGIVLVSFTVVILFGAPYLPTLSPQIKTALDLANLKKGDTLIELGSGDGRVLLAAAKRGVNAVGYELNPVLVLISWIVTMRYRSKVKIIWGDFWHKEWPNAEVIFTFLLPKYMTKLDSKIMKYPSRPVKLISFAFKINDKTAVSEKNGVFRYDYS